MYPFISVLISGQVVLERPGIVIRGIEVREQKNRGRPEEIGIKLKKYKERYKERYMLDRNITKKEHREW